MASIQYLGQNYLGQNSPRAATRVRSAPLGVAWQNASLCKESELMTSTSVKNLNIAAGGSQQLSKNQKTFNTLIKQIEKRRAELAAWEAVAPGYQQKYASDLLPLVETSTDLQIALVHRLDQASTQNGLTKTERRTIAGLISELAGAVLAERDDAELKAIYNKHSRSDYDREEAAAAEQMKFEFEDMFGFELDDDSSPEDFLKRAQAQYEADQRAREERLAKRKKSAKQLAREAQQQAEAKQIGQSIREVYRKLASAVHPDRETDAHERDRKTALMQRANQAYESNNLLQLLELQLELEHIDQTAINNISEERLKHYNKILKGQLVELDQQVLHAEGRFRAQFGISPFAGVSPSTIMRDLASDIADLRRAIRELKKDLLALQDLKRLKSWLRDLRNQPRRTDLDDLPF